MSVPLDHPAVATFLDFAAAMNRWSWTMIRHFDRMRAGEELTQEEHDGAMAARRGDLEAIFERYCVEGSQAVRVREGMTFTKPPEYDPQAATILAVEPDGDSVRITTIDPTAVDVRTNQPVGPECRERYTMVERAGRWLVQGKHKSSTGGRKWSASFV